ncbi:MAG: amino acid ABC transporter substrate-binding protein [Clostridia bacterium]|nr:amino acid ABC transporter substrate-binding protein [Clostridia bacterium]
MKRIICLALVVLMGAVLLSGCTKGGGDLLAEVKKKGKLTIAMEGTWAPWTYHDESGELVGFDVEVGKAIAERLGVEAEFIEGEWDGLFAGMDSRRYDLVINGVDITDERKEKYDFSEPYAFIRTVLIVRGDNEDIKSFEDLSGKTTANSIGSTYMELAEQYGAKVEGVDSLAETMQMVISGRVDATLNAEVSVADYLKEHPDADIKQVAATEEANHVAIPMRKGAETETLRKAIDEALASMHEDGTLSALSMKYFGVDITK